MHSPKRPANVTCVSTELLQTLLHSLKEELPQALTLRELLHATPEPSHGEQVTAGLVANALGAHSVERVASTGLMARIGPPGKGVAVRAELDALPIEEETGAPFASTNGWMHACGHDVHMAALTALFRAASRVAGSLPEPLIALYQPSEEAYPSGADLVVREGALAKATDAIVAAHVHPDVPWGSVSVEVGLEGSPGASNVPLHHPRFLPSDEAVGAVARAQALAFAAAATLR